MSQEPINLNETDPKSYPGGPAVSCRIYNSSYEEIACYDTGDENWCASKAQELGAYAYAMKTSNCGD